MARSHIDRERLAVLVSRFVDTGAPTGFEAPLARVVATELARSGIESRVQELDPNQANAVARLPGGRGSPSLLLYAPLDTVTVGREQDDLPWAGPELRADMRPRAVRAGDVITGLGAHNPLGHAACVVAAVEAVAAAGVPLAGDLWAGLGAGGMPCDPRPGDDRSVIGHGVGCRALVEEVRPARAVIAKSGWSVSHEEVGLMWFDVEVRGTHTYVGSRHLIDYVNAIREAGRVIEELETRWFGAWAEAHTSGLVRPQGVVSHIRAGWPHMAAFTPAVCRFGVDLRIGPRTTPAEAEAEFGAALEAVAARTGVDLSWSTRVAIPGTSTPAGARVIRSTVAAWERLTGVAHTPPAGMSGATDANILRGAGIPTARVGLPKVPAPGGGDTGTVAGMGREADFQAGMNTVSLDDMEMLTALLVEVAVDLCGPPPGGES